MADMLWRILNRILRKPEHPRPDAGTAAYSSAIFDVGDVEAAKVIILNPTPDMTTSERWEAETRNLADALGPMMGIGPDSLVLDYGCGIGRVSRALIERYRCSAVGVDISPGMRELAVRYVQSDRFTVCDPDELERKVREGFRATHACACWVLQHCPSPETDIARIHASLAEGGHLFVLNGTFRWVPTDRGWAEDTVSVEELLARRFETLSKTGTSDLVVSRVLAEQSYAMLLRKTGSC